MYEAAGPAAVAATSIRVSSRTHADRQGGGLQEGIQEMSPDNVAPAVAYLASTRSDWCTGQVIVGEAMGYTIGLYNVPELIRQVRSPGPWDLEMAYDMIEKSFRPAARANRTVNMYQE
jgi:hypothetical protein